jgi:hypothetical protein
MTFTACALPPIMGSKSHNKKGRYFNSYHRNKTSMIRIKTARMKGIIISMLRRASLFLVLALLPNFIRKKSEKKAKTTDPMQSNPSALFIVEVLHFPITELVNPFLT